MLASGGCMSTTEPVQVRLNWLHWFTHWGATRKCTLVIFYFDQLCRSFLPICIAICILHWCLKKLPNAKQGPRYSCQGTMYSPDFLEVFFMLRRRVHIELCIDRVATPSAAATKNYKPAFRTTWLTEEHKKPLASLNRGWMLPQIQILAQPPGLGPNLFVEEAGVTIFSAISKGQTCEGRLHFL